MNVGVYVDGFNLYFGAKAITKPVKIGWKWLDVRALAASQLSANWQAKGARVSRVVYCTARVSGASDPTTPADQDRYLRALAKSGSVDVFEYGNFLSSVRTSPVADYGPKGKPRVVTSAWPLMVKDSRLSDVQEAVFIVSHLYREEKGSDVNVATHLLVDVFQGAIDAAVVISNDSDLALPIKVARGIVPVGVVNPGIRPTAGGLKGNPVDGVGDHWWTTLDQPTITANQLADPVEKIAKPDGW